MLEMRANCEKCGMDLPAEADHAKVEPLPPKGSSTMQLVRLELRIGYATRATGFMVGWSLFFLGFSNSHMVVCLRSAYQLCFPDFFQPKRTGSCCH